ncbi:hypothetical protein AGMMS49546_36180 [Spirochaetia bacterium]|nr:hypothetical protein AGMMS49546_36180 [Spirochaetia bacterium]
MSDIASGISPEEKLARHYRDLLINTACCCVGWFMFWFGGSYFQDGTIIVLLGVVIGVAPLLLKMVQTRSLKALFFWRNYEVVTTHSDGRKTSDGGFESGMLQLMIYAFMAMIVLLILSILMPVRILIAAIKYLAAYRKVLTKPDFLHSAFPLLIACVIAFLAAPILAQKLPNPAKIAAINAQNASDYTPAETRTMIDGAKTYFLSGAVDYTVEVSSPDSKSSYRIEVQSRGNDTKVNVPLGEGESPVQGWYTFKGTEFVEFDANGYHNEQPSAADIETLKAMLPANLVLAPFGEAKDSDLWAKNLRDSVVRLELFRTVSGDNDPRWARYDLSKTGDTYRIDQMIPKGSGTWISFSYPR